VTGLPLEGGSGRGAAVGVQRTQDVPAPAEPEGVCQGPSRGKVVCSAIVFAGAVAYLALGARYALFTPDGDVGPGFLPRVVAVALVVTTGWSLVVDVRRRGEPFGERGRMRDVATISGLVLMFVVLTVVIGSMLAAPLFIFGTLALFNRGRWRQNVLVSVAVGAILYGLLVLWLDAPVADGLLGLLR
jgi:putative tricarboxylic transport membrane protein